MMHDFMFRLKLELNIHHGTAIRIFNNQPPSAYTLCGIGANGACVRYNSYTSHYSIPLERGLGRICYYVEDI
jgi:hypothetical protein